MNFALVHLAVNHLSLFAVIFMIALLIWGLWRQSPDLVQAGLVLGVVVGVGAVLANLSGERAEDVVEDIPVVSHERIEEHEESAEFATWIGGALGLVSLAGLVLSLRSGEIPRKTSRVVLALAVLTLAVVARTSWLGGEIRHPEAHGLPVEGMEREP